ncbi:unnamed protein product [Psylliodes chrysocephalus]|uniref:C-type lectin domain-containing protein n=1 Tax=Psylliodes chrysocephalus TaxID=3402493 RepID=A0A9P0CV52_9CUCU|nr:unnamed protein product [Psylliodes chrysocephala]
MNYLLAISCVFICFTTIIAFPKNDLQHTFKQGNKSFLIHTVKMNFSDAYNFCKNSNLQLAAVETIAEDDKIFKELSYLGFFLAPKAFWTSGTKLANSNRWIWLISTKTIAYFNWGDAEPSKKYGNEFCIAVHPDNYSETGYWSARNCSSTAYPICQTVSLN